MALLRIIRGIWRDRRDICARYRFKWCVCAIYMEDGFSMPHDECAEIAHWYY